MSKANDPHVHIHSETEGMEQRMLAFIFPNTPRTPDEKDAFRQAVEHQIEHERSLFESMDVEDMNLPNGVSSFSIGNFSMSFGDDGYRNSAVLTKETICPVAYGILLRAGLLYRGVIGGCCYPCL